MNAILALDLGTKTGWALREHGRTESGVQIFDVKRGESPGMRYVYQGNDDNEADALWLLAYAESVILPPLAVAGA